jgi:hypothetical protein
MRDLTLRRSESLSRLAIHFCFFSVWLLAAPGGLWAQAFLRGDANSDGNVTGSDSHYMLSYLFRGSEPPECLRAADVNDNGSLDISDSIFLLNFRYLGGPAPCEPFPEPGTDSSSELPCREYTPTPPAEDPRYVLEVSDAIASSEGITTITLFVTNPTPIAGYFTSLVLDSGRFGSVSRVTDLSGALAGGFLAARAFGGKVRVGFLTSIVDVVTIDPGELRPVLQIECCLESGLAAGDYEVSAEGPEVTDAATGRAVLPAVSPGLLSVPVGLGDTGCESPADPPETPTCGEPDPPDPPTPVCLPDLPPLAFLRGDINLDGRVSLSDGLWLGSFLFVGGPVPPCCDAADVDDSGSLSLTDVVFSLNHLFFGGTEPPAPFPERGADPTPDNRLGCGSDTVTPTPESDDVLALGEVSALRGSTVSIPVRLTSTEATNGFQLIFQVEPATLLTADASPPLSFDGTFFEGLPGDEGVFSAVVEVEGHPDTFAVGFIPSLIESRFVTPGEDRLVFFIRMRLSFAAEPGTLIRLELTDGPGGEGFGAVGLQNELSANGAPRRPRLLPGAVRVVEGEAILRGDSDHNGRHDLTDSVFTLSFLFLGGRAPPCADEADVNDDGRLDIADPISLLGFLFLGHRSPRPPFPEPDVDPTEDELPGCTE